MKRYLFLVFIVQLSFAQQPFPINRYGEVTDRSLDKLIKKRGYEVVSAFDTVSKTPLMIYAQYLKGGKFGILNVNGVEVTGAVYDKIVGLELLGANKFKYPSKYIVKENGKYGLIQNTGKQLLPSTLDGLSYKEGDSLFVLTNNNSRTIVNASGQFVKQVTDYNQEETPRKATKPNKILSDDGKTYNLRTYSGKEITVPNIGAVVQQYEETVTFKDEKNKVGLYSAKAQKLVVPFIYDGVELVSKGHYKVWQGNLYGVVDSIGQVKLPLKYEFLGFTSGGTYAYRDKKYTIFDKNYLPLSDLAFDGYSYLGLKGLILKYNGKYGILDTIGKVIAPFEYDMMSVPQDHDLPFTIVLASKGGKYGVMDFSGKVYTAFKYDEVLPESLLFSDSIIMVAEPMGISNQPNRFHFVKIGAKYGLLDNDFKMILPAEYDYFLKCGERNVLRAKKGGKWGLIDARNFKILIPFIYDIQPEYKNGNYWVTKDKQYGLVNRTGKYLIPLGELNNFNSDKTYKGLWQVSNYLERSSFYLDYAGRRTSKVFWKQ
ncbi:MAG: WG repeat-containing protein [Flavobacterium sp.]|nr:WG repeat-containing protein [Flavobacterium sp.]